ncbi:MAG: hypothetical protein U0800_06415 [Isosphaeraceae bacterium]
MKSVTVAVAMGTGREGWLSFDTDSLRFSLVIENGKRSEEILTLADLKNRYPFIADYLAGVLAQAVRVNPT